MAVAFHSLHHPLHSMPQSKHRVELHGNHRRLLDKQLYEKQQNQNGQKSQIAIDHVHIGAQAKQRRHRAHDDHRVAVAELIHQQMMQVALIRLRKLHSLQRSPQNRRQRVHDRQHQ